MKKVVAICLVVVMCLSLIGAGAVFAEEAAITVTLNGVAIEFDQPPIIEDGRTLVPMRKIFEAMGAAVDWNGETQTVTGTKGDIVVTMQIGNNVITKNGQGITLDVPPQLVNSRTLVPVRAVAESFNAKVDWNGETQTVIITTTTSNVKYYPYSHINVPDFGVINNLVPYYTNDHDGGTEYFVSYIVQPNDIASYLVEYVSVLWEEGFVTNWEKSDYYKKFFEQEGMKTSDVMYNVKDTYYVLCYRDIGANDITIEIGVVGEGSDSQSISKPTATPAPTPTPTSAYGVLR